MTKHVSSGDDKAQASQRDAATESLPTQAGTDDDAQALSQGAADGHPVEAMAPDVATDAVVDAASGADRRSERNDARGNQTAPAATASRCHQQHCRHEAGRRVGLPGCSERRNHRCRWFRL